MLELPIAFLIKKINNFASKGMDMKRLLLLAMLITTSTAFAEGNLSKDTHSGLKKLYYVINQSVDPHSDPDVANEVTKMVNKSCFESAQKALDRRSDIALDKKEKMMGMLRSTCSCVSKSDDMITGVIKSATLFKEHGKASSEARKAMKNGMRAAKAKCFKKMRSQMGK